MNILVLAPVDYDGTSFYRAYGPLNMLCKQDRSIKLKKCDCINWYQHSWADILFAQRPFKKEHLEAIIYAKGCGVKIWVDYDDNLFDVGYNNPAYDLYRDAKTRGIIKKCTELADLVTVSTEPLTAVYKNKNTIIVPNAYPDYLTHYFETKPQETPSIIWRGSNSHNRDLLLHKDEIQTFMKEQPEIKWHFIGQCPWMILDGLETKNIRYYKTVDCIQLYDLISDINPAIGVVPLENNHFNECKSNIAWLEFLAGGAITVAPNMKEWNRKGIVKYSQGKLSSALKGALAMPYEERKKAVKEARAFVKENIVLSKVNMLRLQSLRQLLC